MDAGGNSGGQTTTMIVRSLSLDEFSGKDYGRVVWKEIRVATIIGAIVAAFAFGWLMFEMGVGIVNTDSILERIAITGGNYNAYMAMIAALVASTLFVTMIISRMVGCSLPFLAKLVKLDPAVMCGPITTTMVDVISLITYFLLWTQIIGPQLGF
jgi:magnesium transporter